MDIQELITRGRFVFSKAEERLRVFGLVNGRRNTANIARETRRHVNSVHRDLQKLLNSELIRPKTEKAGEPLKIDGLPVYEKVPLARTIPIAYFRGPSKPLGRLTRTRESTSSKAKAKRPAPLAIPTETELLDICRSGEDQLYEFKGQGTDTKKIAREIAAMLNTRQGGVVFYGISDEGTIQGSDMSRQKLDQAIQNSVKNRISPAATIKLFTVRTVGHEIVAIAVPPWNRKDVYHYDERVLLRKGTNVFAAKPEESKKLHRGEYVI